MNSLFRAWSAIFPFILILCFMPHARAQCTGHWLPPEPVPSVIGSLQIAYSRSTSAGTELIVGGDIQVAGAVQVQNIAAFDGNSWYTLGQGLNAQVRVLIEFNGELIAAGNFTASGSTPIQHVARWDGTSWHALGGGVGGSVNALAVFHGELVAGGQFTSADGAEARNIARWDGTQWRPLAGGVNNSVAAICVHGDTLVATGTFTDAGGGAAARIAQWDGSAWSPLGSGLSAGGTCLTSLHGILYVGGNFQTAGGVAARRMAAWNGTTWSAVGGETLQTVPLSLIAFEGQLVATGSGAPLWVKVWNGVAWNAVGDQTTLSGSGRFLVHEGELAMACRGAEFVEVLQGNVWERIGVISWDQPPSHLFEHDGLIVAAGSFTEAPSVEADGIAIKDGDRWYAMNNGLDLSAFGARLNATATYGGAIVGGGAFGVLDDGSANLATWDGQRWRPMAGGFPNEVISLTADATHLYAATLHGVRRFNGSSWTTLAGGLQVEAFKSIGVFDGVLYATGEFRHPNNLQEVVAKWDGSAWVAFPADLGLMFNPPKLKVLRDGLYLLADYGTPFAALIRWNGSSATVLLEEIAIAYVDDVAYLGNSLIAVGIFPFGPTATIARWDGVQWTPFPASLDSTSFDRSCAVSGSILTVSGQLRFEYGTYTARWRDVTGDFDGDGALTDTDIDLYVEAFEAGTHTVDLDDDGFVTGTDFDLFIQAFEAGC